MTKSLPLAFSLLALTACSSSSNAGSSDSGVADSASPSDSSTTPTADSSTPSGDANGPAADSGPGVDSAAEIAHCGQPGDTGNSLGVGKYCVTSADCKGTQTTLCSSLGGPATSFCTLICTPSDAGNPCGDGATCGCQASSGTCACTPNYCL